MSYKLVGLKPVQNTQKLLSPVVSYHPWLKSTPALSGGKRAPRLAASQYAATLKRLAVMHTLMTAGDRGAPASTQAPLVSWLKAWESPRDGAGQVIAS